MSISLNNFDQSQQTSAPVTDIGLRVKAAREAVRYSIEDLAVTCGLANSEIVEIEDGKQCDPASLKRIASALQVPVSAFIADGI